ncbi:MAG: CBS domain-containing protein [Archangium sp.]|nr:CBS domain-containing protein [Archangium sp.]
MPPHDEDAVVTLRERERVTIDAEREKTTRTTVHCPIEGGTQTADHCRACPRFESESSSALSCRVPAATAVPRGVVGELLSGRSFCLDGELPVGPGAEVLERHDIAAAPVVDDHHVLVGMVTTQALMHAELEEAQLRGFGSLSSTSEVEDVMVTPVTSFAETMPIVEAARIMTERGLSSVPVVDAHGEVVGVLEAHDFVRFVARSR